MLSLRRMMLCFCLTKGNQIFKLLSNVYPQGYKFDCLGSLRLICSFGFSFPSCSLNIPTRGQAKEGKKDGINFSFQSLM